MRGQRTSQQPPPGKPWDEPIQETRLAFVDVETTGLDVQRDQVVEICVELVQRGELIGRLSSLVNPGARAGGSAHIHGLSAETLASAPSFASLAQQVADLLEGAVFVAHASSWDVMFLEAEMVRAAKPFQIQWHLDTLGLARRAFGLRSNRLSALAKSLGIEQRRAHRAEDDVAVLRGVFERVLAVLRPETARDLWESSVEVRRSSPQVVAACAEAVGQGPMLIRYRPSGRAAESFPFVVTHVRTDLDPPLVIGYLVPGRGHRDLRSDRILAVEPCQGSSNLAPGPK